MWHFYQRGIFINIIENWNTPVRVLTQIAFAMEVQTLIFNKVDILVD